MAVEDAKSGAMQACRLRACWSAGRTAVLGACVHSCHSFRRQSGGAAGRCSINQVAIAYMALLANLALVGP